MRYIKFEIKSERGKRAELCPVDDAANPGYIDPIDRVLKPFTDIPNVVQCDNLVYVSSAYEKYNDVHYAHVHKISEGDKLYCSDESDLYKLEKELNEMGYKTRIGRNMYSGVLSMAILEVPDEVKEGEINGDLYNK